MFIIISLFENFFDRFRFVKTLRHCFVHFQTASS
jgi:hypothetical protein